MSITTDKPSSFTPELATVDGKITTTSQQIAQHFGKEHKSVLRAIKNLECSPEYHQRNFAPMVIETAIGSGATRKDPAFRLTRDGFVFLAMGFTGKEAAQWKEAYIEAFNRMESQLTQKSTPSLMSRRWIVSMNGDSEQITPVPFDAAIVSPSKASDIHNFLFEMIPQHLIPKAIDSLNCRLAQVLCSQPQRNEIFTLNRA